MKVKSLVDDSEKLDLYVRSLWEVGPRVAKSNSGYTSYFASMGTYN